MCIPKWEKFDKEVISVDLSLGLNDKFKLSMKVASSTADPTNTISLKVRAELRFILLWDNPDQKNVNKGPLTMESWKKIRKGVLQTTMLKTTGTKNVRILPLNVTEWKL